MNWYKKAIGKEYPSEMQRRMPETDQQLYDYFHSDDPPRGEPAEKDFWDQYHLKPYQKQKAHIMKSRSHPLSGEPWDIRQFNKVERKKINYEIRNGLKKILQNTQKINDISRVKYAPELIGIPIKYIKWIYKAFSKADGI
jgi:hypothetical protein